MLIKKHICGKRNVNQYFTIHHILEAKQCTQFSWKAEEINLLSRWYLLFPQRGSCPTRNCTKPWPLGHLQRNLFFHRLSTSHLRQAGKKDRPHKGANSPFLSSSEYVQDCETKRMIFVSYFAEDLSYGPKQRGNTVTSSHTHRPHLPQQSSEWSHS